MEHEITRKQSTMIAVISLLAVTLLAYYPVLWNEFVNYDDPQFVTNNPFVQAGLSLKGLHWAFTSSVVYNWHPLTNLSHMLDAQLFGLSPWGHHLTSLVLHAANTLLLFFFLRQAGASINRSILVAALFALHPLHVESVAWVSERKDVLSTMFGLLSLIAYQRYARNPRTSAYVLCALLLVLGLMSKAMLVTFPFLMLMIDYWPLEQTSFNTGPETEGLRRGNLPRLILEKVPLLALAIVSAIITYAVQQHGGAVTKGGGLFDTIGNAFVSYISYCAKMFWPFRLASFYPYINHSVWQILIAVSIVLLTTCATILYVKKYPWLAFGWFWYLGTLVPVIGIIRVGQQAIADRYTYIPYIGLFIIVVWGGSELFNRFQVPSLARSAVCAAILLVCAILTNLQSRIWHDSVTLFSHALKNTENNWVAHKNLAHALERQGKFDEALQHATESLRIWPEPAEYVSQAWLYIKLGQFPQAIESCRKALALAPNNDKAYFILGLAANAGQAPSVVLEAHEMLRKLDSPYAPRLFQAINAGGIP